MKTIKCVLDRKELCAGLLVLLFSAFSPIAHAGASDASPYNVCDQAFHEANWRDDWAFKKYTKQGGDVAAWKAVRHNKAKLLKRLISESPELVNKPLLLVLAASDRDPTPLAIFLANGADPNATGEPASLLAAAVECRRTENVTLLLAAGANVYWKDPLDSQNAMVSAILGGASLPRDNPSPYIQGINLLLAAGYDPRCPVIREITPLQFAEQQLKYYGSSYKIAVEILKHALMVTKARASGPPKCG